MDLTRRQLLGVAAAGAATLAAGPLAPSAFAGPRAAPVTSEALRPDPFALDELPLQGLAGACSSSRPRPDLTPSFNRRLS